MDNFEQIKLEWQTPEIIDLDIADSASGPIPNPTELSSLGS